MIIAEQNWSKEDCSCTRVLSHLSDENHVHKLRRHFHNFQRFEEVKSAEMVLFVLKKDKIIRGACSKIAPQGVGEASHYTVGPGQAHWLSIPSFEEVDSGENSVLCALKKAMRGACYKLWEGLAPNYNHSGGWRGFVRDNYRRFGSGSLTINSKEDEPLLRLADRSAFGSSLGRWHGTGIRLEQ